MADGWAQETAVVGAAVVSVTAVCAEASCAYTSFAKKAENRLKIFTNKIVMIGSNKKNRFILCLTSPGDELFFLVFSIFRRHPQTVPRASAGGDKSSTFGLVTKMRTRNRPQIGLNRPHIFKLVESVLR